MGTDGRTDTTCGNSDHYGPASWIKKKCNANRIRIDNIILRHYCFPTLHTTIAEILWPDSVGYFFNVVDFWVVFGKTKENTKQVHQIGKWGLFCLWLFVFLPNWQVWVLYCIILYCWRALPVWHKYKYTWHNKKVFPIFKLQCHIFFIYCIKVCSKIILGITWYNSV